MIPPSADSVYYAGTRLLSDMPPSSAAGWRSLLGSVDCVEVEVGCGRGAFILDEAMRRPSSGFLGIELAGKWARVAAAALDRAGLGNAAVVHGDAVGFLRAHVPDESLHAVHVYFPDPWPRARHEKRRIWRGDFVTEVLRVLAPGARIVAATDIKGYFVSIQRMLAAEPWVRQEPLPAAWPMTAYARKFLERGRPVFCTSFVKVAGRPAREVHRA